MRLHWIQHVPFEGLGAIGEWAAQHGHAVTRAYASEERYLPPSDIDLLVVMGGPMSANDVEAHPWLETEARYVKASVQSGIPVLGVCFGAQLLARVLGAEVRPGPHREIGWFPVELTPEGRRTAPFDVLPERSVAFHWHGDTFDVPTGAAHTASSGAYPHQAFSYDGGRVLGLQFHLEMTAEGVRRLVENCPGDLDGSRWVQPAAGLVAGEERWGPSARRTLYTLLDAWAG